MYNVFVMEKYMTSSELLSKVKVKPEHVLCKAVSLTREYLDKQPDPLREANKILTGFGIEKIDNVKKAYVFVMTAVEQSMNSTSPSIETIINRSNQRIQSITDMLGPGAFVVEKEIKETKVVVTKSKKGGSKGAIAMEIYLANKELDDKAIIELIQNELEVSKQNAYTYLYNVKKKANESN